MQHSAVNLTIPNIANGLRVDSKGTPPSIQTTTSTDIQKLRCQLKKICTCITLKQQSNSNQTKLIKKLLHIYDDKTGKKLTLRQLLKNPETNQTCAKSSSNEFGRLMNGNTDGIHGTNTMQMVAPANIPQTKKVTYASMVCDYRPLKS